MKYHMMPFLIPKEGVRYELRAPKNADIYYFKDETAWATLLSFMQKPWYRRWTQEWLSWEIVANKDSIKYYVWASNLELGETFKNKFYAEHPSFEIIEVEDVEVDFARPHVASKMFTESHWTIPLKTYHNEVVDTQAELIEFLDSLKADQEIHMQFLVQPAYGTEKSFRGIVRQFHKEGEDDETLEKDNELYLSAVEGKATRTLSRVSIKVVAVASQKGEAQTLLTAAKGALGTFSSGRLNQLKGREWWWFRTIRPLFRWEYKNRLFPVQRKKKRVVLGTEEMAVMMRLPSAKVDNNKLNRLKMQNTPFPKELKFAKFDEGMTVQLGQHDFHGDTNDVMFDVATLRYHAALIGMSGMGKSTGLFNLIVDLILLKAKGAAIGATVIDPHGDLCQDIAGRIPPEFQHLVRYVKFSEAEIPFNVYDLDFAASEDKIAQTVADVLKRTWKDFWGPNIDDNFLNGGIALQRIGEASLPNLQRLLSDEEYRESVLERLNRDDEIENDLYLYFSNLHGLNDRDYTAKTNSTLNKLRKISLSGVTGKILRAKTNGLRLREAMDEGLITLIDLSELTSDEKKLIGSMCLTFAELAGKSRADTPPSQRDKLPYHFVMVDEAPTLMEHSTDAIESFASELRKYKTSIILAAQGLKGQVPEDVSDAIFRNFGTFISLRLGNPSDAEWVNRSMPSPRLTEEDYLSIEPFHAYMRTQVGNERTRPFLLKLKAPEPALYEEAIADIKKATVAKAAYFEALAQEKAKKEAFIEDVYLDSTNEVVEETEQNEQVETKKVVSLEKSKVNAESEVIDEPPEEMPIEMAEFNQSIWEDAAPVVDEAGKIDDNVEDSAKTKLEQTEQSVHKEESNEKEIDPQGFFL